MCPLLIMGKKIQKVVVTMFENNTISYYEFVLYRISDKYFV
jgi:hypothetical protein